MNQRIAISLATMLVMISSTCSAESIVSQRHVGWNQHQHTDQHTFLKLNNLTPHPFNVEWVKHGTRSERRHRTISPGETRMHFHHQPAEPVIFRLNHQGKYVHVQVYNKNVYCASSAYDCRSERAEDGSSTITINRSLT